MDKAAKAANPFDFISESWLRELDLNQRPSGYETGGRFPWSANAHVMALDSLNS
jgi:hypothetical protein